MRSIQKPVQVPDFYQSYIDKVPDDGQLITHLGNIISETEALLSSLPEEKLLYRYSEGKWTIKDLVQHLSDCERVITYRAMRIARGDANNLPGFDENIFVENAHANQRTLNELLTELKLLRSASIAFISMLEEEALDRTGTANGFAISARLLVNHLYGHHKHHLDIIQLRYITD